MNIITLKLEKKNVFYVYLQHIPHFDSQPLTKFQHDDPKYIVHIITRWKQRLTERIST